MSSSALFADLYEFTMLRAYFELGMNAQATFSLFVRNMPPQRNFLIAAGLNDLLHEIEHLRFEPQHIDYLGSLKIFSPPFLDWLAGFRFSGDIYAMREGAPFFQNEPILEVVAPIAEAQLIETLVLNQIGLQTILASKAARVVAAARGASVVDFGARRAHGMDAATKGARAFYIAGVDATSNVAAGQAYGLPVAGTMAHSFIEACASEADAFQSFSEVFPDTTLLVDTYDTLDGVKKVVALARARGTNFKVRAVRLDSGDLDMLSRQTRRILDDAGLTDVQIVASGGLDEIKIDALTSRGAPIDVFGVGTDMAASSDAPAIDIAYKLTDYAGKGRMKLSAGKRSLPGRKQVFRQFSDGVASRDIIAREGETPPGVPLLQPFMLSGRRVAAQSCDLPQIRDYAKEQLAALPSHLKALGSHARYDVAISDALASYERETRARLID
ncbi:nicotinate phosphoribosyltransferase [Methylocystis sp. SC2]|uniref:nicotinate phosphoribosyltransferase n=1 Tax=Methylocystis sp. (strain SC2) TaxID=187303 RepID=UPI00027AF0A2|nr:nicotinate phosphoribosyltransferase [Methylocystis sp. SC2]CCJ05873.1 Nicotinate phosphoribosyltransferase [Methylocystis sp. SC2]